MLEFITIVFCAYLLLDLYPLCPTKKAKSRQSFYITPISGVPMGGIGGSGPPLYKKMVLEIFPKKQQNWYLKGGKVDPVYFEV